MVQSYGETSTMPNYFVTSFFSYVTNACFILKNPDNIAVSIWATMEPTIFVGLNILFIHTDMYVSNLRNLQESSRKRYLGPVDGLRVYGFRWW